MCYQLIYVKGVLIAKLPSGYPTINFLNYLVDDNVLCNHIEKLLDIDFFDLSDITITMEKELLEVK